jgi:hypothetical protein
MPRKHNCPVKKEGLPVAAVGGPACDDIPEPPEVVVPATY